MEMGSNERGFRYKWLKAVMQAEGLTPTAKVLASALAVQFANEETGQINPSQSTLADYLKVHKDTIKRCLRELRNAGWLLASGSGGRSKAPMMRLVTPGKIIPFRPSQRGDDLPPQAKKRGGDMCQKGGGIAPPLYKDKQSLEHKGGEPPEQRPAALDQFAQHQFSENSTVGPRLVRHTENVELNAWAEWLAEQGLPKLYELPVRQAGTKAGSVFFWLPSKRPPSTPEATSEARSYFAALQDWEACRHAAQ